jgi:hypothetical protein
VADLIEPLYRLMAERVRASHVVATDDTIMPMLSRGKAAPARMWVYVGDGENPYNVFDFTLSRGRDGPKYFLPRLLRGAAGRCLCRVQRRGGGKRDRARGLLGALSGQRLYLECSSRARWQRSLREGVLHIILQTIRSFGRIRVHDSFACLPR